LEAVSGKRWIQTGSEIAIRMTREFRTGCFLKPSELNPPAMAMTRMNAGMNRMRTVDLSP